MLATAVIDGDAELAANLAAEHFHLSEDMLRRLISTVDSEGDEASGPRRNGATSTKSFSKNQQPKTA